MSRPSRPKAAKSRAPSASAQATASLGGGGAVTEATDPAAAMTFGAGGGTQAAEQATKTESTLGDGDATGAAAQAPSADAAPQAPAPDVVKPPAPMVGRVLRVVGPAKGRWRAGRKFGPEPVEIPVAELSLEDMAKLATDPELVVGLVEED